MNLEIFINILNTYRISAHFWLKFLSTMYHIRKRQKILIFELCIFPRNPSLAFSSLAYMFHNRNYFSVKCLVFFFQRRNILFNNEWERKKIFMMQYDFWQIAVALNLQLKIKKKSNQSGFWWNIPKDFRIPIPISLANKEIQSRKTQNIMYV